MRFNEPVPNPSHCRSVSILCSSTARIISRDTILIRIQFATIKLRGRWVAPVGWGPSKQILPGVS